MVSCNLRHICALYQLLPKQNMKHLTKPLIFQSFAVQLIRSGAKIRLFWWCHAVSNSLLQKVKFSWIDKNAIPLGVPHTSGYFTHSYLIVHIEKSSQTSLLAVNNGWQRPLRCQWWEIVPEFECSFHPFKHVVLGMLNYVTIL